MSYYSKTYSPVKVSSKAYVVGSRNFYFIVGSIFIKVPSTLLLVETVESAFKFFSYTLFHRNFYIFQI